MTTNITLDQKIFDLIHTGILLGPLKNRFADLVTEESKCNTLVSDLYSRLHNIMLSTSSYFRQFPIFSVITDKLYNYDNLDILNPADLDTVLYFLYRTDRKKFYYLVQKYGIEINRNDLPLMQFITDTYSLVTEIEYEFTSAQNKLDDRLQNKLKLLPISVCFANQNLEPYDQDIPVQYLENKSSDPEILAKSKLVYMIIYLKGREVYFPENQKTNLSSDIRRIYNIFFGMPYKYKSPGIYLKQFLYGYTGSRDIPSIPKLIFYEEILRQEKLVSDLQYILKVFVQNHMFTNYPFYQQAIVILPITYLQTLKFQVSDLFYRTMETVTREFYLWDKIKTDLPDCYQKLIDLDIDFYKRERLIEKIKSELNIKKDTELIAIWEFMTKNSK